MHREIIEHATIEQLKDFVLCAIDKIKDYDHDLYEELELKLYKIVYGCHFTDWLLEKAIKEMMNEDGTIGAHWTLEQTNSVAKSYGITFTDFNEYDFNYVMNMIYSDYYGSVSNDVSTYTKLAKKWLEDKDAPHGKALKYYLAMKY